MEHNAIELSGLTKRYADFALGPVNLTLPGGAILGLIGENGAGKTTLLQSIINERPYTGSITFKSHMNTEIKKPKIGYVPQQLTFDKSTPVSVADFMLSTVAKRPIWLGGEKSRIKDIENRLESLKIGYLLNRPLGSLSGGEIQRVLLLTALEPL